MKKLLLFIAILFTIGFNNEADAQNINYNRIDVYNSNGLNTTDFVFTYDNGTCRNNFKVINNTGYTTTFNFKIHLNGSWRYTGVVTVAPYSSVFFNNAFNDCNSASDYINIQCW